MDEGPADADGGGEDDDHESYQLGPDGTPVGGGETEPPEPETAVEYRRAARQALGAGDPQGALNSLDQALELARDADDAAMVAGVLTDRGNVRMEQADPDGQDPRAAPDAEELRETIAAAVADYTAALEEDPEAREAYFNRGLARARLGERESSTADLERAADLGASNPFLVRGNACVEAGADEYAREDFGRAIDRTGAARAYFNRGNANRRLGDDAAAVADYESALDRAGDLPDDGRRVLVQLGAVAGEGTADSRSGDTAAGPAEETAATYRLRASSLAVAHRDVWRGVALAEQALADADEGTEPWLEAAAVVVAGDALRTAAGYGADDDLDADVGRLREALADASLPDATATLFAAAGTEDTPDEPDLPGAPPAGDLADAVASRDHAALRAAGAEELIRQLRFYR